MKEFTYKICDNLGIHARPAGLLVKKAGGFSSTITIYKDEKSADCKRLFAVMGLSVKRATPSALRQTARTRTLRRRRLRDFSEIIYRSDF